MPIDTKYLGSKWKSIQNQRKPVRGNLLQFEVPRSRSDILQDMKKADSKNAKVKRTEWKRIDQILGLEGSE